MEPATQFSDDDPRTLRRRTARPPLPAADESGQVEHDAARIWYASYGAGAPVILLHGGLGHSGNWGYQVPALVGRGVSRGRDRQPRPWPQHARCAPLQLRIDGLRRARRDGHAATRAGRDGGLERRRLRRAGARPPARPSAWRACSSSAATWTRAARRNSCRRRSSIDASARHAKDYAQLSATPDDFDAFVGAVSEMMRTQPNYSAARPGRGSACRLLVVQSEHDEFIKPEHADYLARSIPGAALTLLPGVSHFAPLQRPAQFNRAVLDFLHRVLP